MAGIIPAIRSIALTPAEVAVGFSFNPLGSGYSLVALLTEALLDLDSAYVKLAAAIAVMPNGANKTVMSAQLAALIVAAISLLWDDTLTWVDTNIWAD